MFIVIGLLACFRPTFLSISLVLYVGFIWGLSKAVIVIEKFQYKWKENLTCCFILLWFRILSEYLGLETMLAIVCRTYECVKVLEKYDEDGMIISSAGIHGLGSSIKNSIKGRFQVLCLEDLRQEPIYCCL